MKTIPIEKLHRTIYQPTSYTDQGKLFQVEAMPKEDLSGERKHAQFLVNIYTTEHHFHTHQRSRQFKVAVMEYKWQLFYHKSTAVLWLSWTNWYTT